ncbi:hypothetical protein Y032_0002g1146 [Ancylostoma ceylanicum]|uniref:Uncharacterized protein n=1 Tax=Ancylostoma ceylanicum TaxID=53326 RepID=A0A016W0S2_9BILA|nr:hypothetical protein Y032_0002g1146 [Ancylostoma ceylanicum]
MITPILPPTHRLDRSAAIPFWKKKWLSTIFLSAISVIDIRLPPTTNFKEMDELIDSWCKKAGPGVTYKFLVKTEIPVMTPTTSDDPFWAAFEKSLQDENCDFEKEIFTGATDSRFVREVSANLGLFCSMRFHRPSSDRCRSALHRMLSSS